MWEAPLRKEVRRSRVDSQLRENAIPKIALYWIKAVVHVRPYRGEVPCELTKVGLAYRGHGELRDTRGRRNYTRLYRSRCSNRSGQRWRLHNGRYGRRLCWLDSRQWFVDRCRGLWRKRLRWRVWWRQCWHSKFTGSWFNVYPAVTSRRAPSTTFPRSSRPGPANRCSKRERAPDGKWAA